MKVEIDKRPYMWIVLARMLAATPNLNLFEYMCEPLHGEDPDTIAAVQKWLNKFHDKSTITTAWFTELSEIAYKAEIQLRKDTEVTRVRLDAEKLGYKLVKLEE